MKKLEERVAVVTGAASGIGRATAKALAGVGCDVAVVDIDATGAEGVADEIRRLGRRASAHAADVADRGRMTALVGEIVDQHGRVNVLVNNAGVTVARSFEDHTLGDLDWVIGINLWGVIHGCKLFLPVLRAQDEAHIVNISSMAGFMGMPLQSGYCTTKFAVRGLTESLYTELASTSVGVTAVYPGPFNTRVLSSARHDGTEVWNRVVGLLAKYGRSPDAVAQRIVRAVRRRELHAVVGGSAHLTGWAKRLMPTWPNSLLAWGYDVAGPTDD